MANNRTVLSIHQPNFLPWLGYFDKINNSDVFIILDSVQIPRGKSIANRNKIKTAQGELELVVPLSRPKGNDGKVTYREVQIADPKWAKKALKALELNYGKAPYFERYFSELKDLFYLNDFCQMNVQFIRKVTNELDIDTPMYLLSELQEDMGNKNELIASLCRHFHANVYLSGKGARKYNDPDYLSQFDIELEYQEFEHPVYEQLHGDFIPDLLFNYGPESTQFF